MIACVNLRKLVYFTINSVCTYWNCTYRMSQKSIDEINENSFVLKFYYQFIVTKLNFSGVGVWTCKHIEVGDASGRWDGQKINIKKFISLCQEYKHMDGSKKPMLTIF